MVSKPKNSSNKIEENDDINITEFLVFVKRNLKLISSISIISIIIGLIHAYSAKRIWQGEFQIVLNSEKDNSSAILDNLGEINLPISLNLENNNLKTEVGILESPLVLDEVFKFVKKNDTINNDGKPSNLVFKKWKKSSLNIELEKGTSILNLEYRDSNKDIILPVLNKISESYQEYSGRKRLRDIELGKKYFKEQIAIFNQKSLESYRKAQQFASNYDLMYLTNLQGLNDRSEDDDNPKGAAPPPTLLPIINIESKRVESANLIRTLEIQINKLKNIDRNVIDAEFLISLSIDKETSNEVLKNEIELNYLKSIYKENDKLITQLTKKNQLLKENLLSKAISALETQKLIEEAKLKSAERPKGVLFEYQELLRNAAKDSRTLDYLENQLRVTFLNEAKTKDPWELITSPTLLNYPVEPNKKLILAGYLLMGIFAGLIISKIIEKRNEIKY